ncbi:MAG TPA: hypothetical protein VK961_11010 [Chthoniobacter sp.]|nr:hypothetical protein [Chthoniobacter sp.]
MLRIWIRVLLGVFSLFIATLVIFLGMKMGFGAGSFLILALCAYFPFGWLLHRRWAVSWRYRHHRDQFIEHTVIITNDDVMVSSIHTDLRVNWDRLAFVVSTPHGLLFFIRPRAGWFWLPQRLFEDNQYKDAILELSTEHKIPIRHMS